MRWSEYKKKKQQEMEFEEKARQKVNGVWSFLSFILSYKLKELLLIILILIFSSSAAMIVEPKIAIWAHDAIAKKISAKIGEQ